MGKGYDIPRTDPDAREAGPTFAQMVNTGLERLDRVYNPLNYFLPAESPSVITDVQLNRMAARWLAERPTRAGVVASPGPIYLPEYDYDLRNPVDVGDATRTSGAVILGDNMHAPRLNYSGPTGAETAVIRGRNLNNPYVADITYRCVTKPGASLWLGVDDGASMINPQTARLLMSGSSEGVRIGGTIARALAGTLHASTGQGNCGTHIGHETSTDYAARVCGVNTEQQAFKGLNHTALGLAGSAAVWSQNARGITIDEGEFHFGDFQAWLVKVTNYTTPGGMGLTAKGSIRIEKMSGLLYVDGDGAGGGCGSQQPFSALLEGIEGGSIGLGGAYDLTDWRAPGTLIMQAVRGGALDGKIKFGATNFSSAMFNSIRLLGCAFNSTGAAANPLALVSGTVRPSPAPGAAGGLRCRMEECDQMANAGGGYSIAQLPNRTFTQTADQILAGTYT